MTRTRRFAGEVLKVVCVALLGLFLLSGLVGAVIVAAGAFSH